MAKDGGTNFSKTGGGWGKVVPPQKKSALTRNTINISHVPYPQAVDSCLPSCERIKLLFPISTQAPQVSGS